MRGDEDVLRELEDSPVVGRRVTPKAHGETRPRSLTSELLGGFATIDREGRSGNIRHREASSAELLAEPQEGEKPRSAFGRRQVRGGLAQQIHLEVRELVHEEPEKPVPVEVRVSTRVRPDETLQDAAKDASRGHGAIVPLPDLWSPTFLQWRTSDGRPPRSLHSAATSNSFAA